MQKSNRHEIVVVWFAEHAGTSERPAQGKYLVRRMSKMNHEQTLRIMRSIMAMVCLATASNVTGAPAANRPNIILCMADDQGWGDTGYNGHPFLKTPHLDQLSREGVTFTRF